MARLWTIVGWSGVLVTCHTESSYYLIAIIFYFLYLDGSFKTLVTVYSLGIYVKNIKREITFGVQ